MTVEAYATLAILIGLFALLIKTKLPPAAIFMGALTLVITLRLAPLEECLRGFSNAGMLTIGALFMVAAGMYTTGAIGMVSEKPRILPIYWPQWEGRILLWLYPQCLSVPCFYPILLRTPQQSH